MTNIERSFSTIDVIKVKDNTHFVKLFLHSMDQYLYFNGYINILISRVIDGTGANEENVDLDDIPNFDSQVQKEQLPAFNFIRKPSNYEAVSDLISRAFSSTNVVNDDNVPLLGIEITRVISPFEFYAVPDLKKTKAYYISLFQEITSTVMMHKDEPFNFNTPSQLIAYFHQQKQMWRRGCVLKVDKTQECEELNEYTIEDYDDLTIYKQDILQWNIHKYVRPLPDKYFTKSQAFHCVIPNIRLSEPDRYSEEAIQFFNNFIKLNQNNLFVLPLSQLSGIDNQLVVNLYVREMMLTGMFEAKKQHFKSYISSLHHKLRKITNFNLQFKLDFSESIYRNLCSVNLFNVDDLAPFENSHYRRVVYPNTPNFSGEITYYNQKRNKLCFRYENHQDMYQQVLQRLKEIAQLDAEGKLARIKKTIVELYPCVVYDIIEQKQAPWLPKIMVRQLDNGRTMLYYIEDLRDIAAVTNVPVLAVPCRVMGHLDPDSQLLKSVGKKASFSWVVIICFCFI